MKMSFSKIQMRRVWRQGSSVTETIPVRRNLPQGVGVIGQDSSNVSVVIRGAMREIPACVYESAKSIMDAQGLCSEIALDHFLSLLNEETCCDEGVFSDVIEDMQDFVELSGGECNLVYKVAGVYLDDCKCPLTYFPSGYTMVCIINEGEAGHCLAVYSGEEVLIKNNLVVALGLLMSAGTWAFGASGKPCFRMLPLMLAALTIPFSFELGLLSVAIVAYLVASKEYKPTLTHKVKPSRVVEARLQMFGLGETHKKLDDLLDAMKTTSSNSSDLITSLLGILRPDDSFLDGAVFNGLMKIIRVGVNCSMAKDNLKVWNFLFNVASEFGPQSVKILTPILSSRIGVNGRVVDGQRQGIDDFVSELSDDEDAGEDGNLSDKLRDFFGENRTMTRLGMAASLALLLQIAIGVPVTTDVDRMLKFFGDRARNMNNVLTFGKNSSDLFQGAADWVIETLLPGFGKVELDDYVEGYDAWAKEVLSLSDPQNPVHVRVQKEKQLVFQIERLYKTGVEYSSIVKGLRVKPVLVEHYQKVFKAIESYRKLCDYTGVFGNRPRAKPLVAYLFGASGVGKSGMSWPLACDLNAFFSDSLEQSNNFAGEIYFRNVEQVFWDAYCGQNICVYDDFGQRVDSQSSNNEEYMELIRTSNIAPYPLHMASIEEKKRTKFVSKAIILTSNRLEQKVSSLTFPDAVFRRIDICGEVQVKPEFTKKCFSQELNESVDRLDRTKTNGPVDTRVYMIKLYDPESKRPLRTQDGQDVVVDYEDFVAMCCAKANQTYSDSMEFNAQLSHRMTLDRMQKLKVYGGILPHESYKTPFERIVDEHTRSVNADTQGISQALWFVRNFGLRESLSVSALAVRNWITSRFVRPKGYQTLYEGETPVLSYDYMKDTYYGLKSKLSSEDLRLSLKKRYETIATLRNLLIVLGLVSAGLGLWYFSKRSRTQRVATATKAETTRAMMVKCRDILENPSIRTEASSSNDFHTPSVRRPVVEASSSGDQHTRRVPRPGFEATSSGDNFTRVLNARVVESASFAPNAEKKLLTEAASSADQVTKCNPRIETEAFASGDGQTRATPRAKYEGEEVEMQAWADRAAGDIISHRILSNLYRIYSDGDPCLNGLFIRDTIMLAPLHLRQLLKKDKSVTIINGLGTKFEVPYDTLKFVNVRNDRNKEYKDAMLIQFPRYVHGHTDLVKHFQKMPELSYRAANVCIPLIRDVGSQRIFTILGNTQANFEAILLKTENGDINIRSAISYRLNTIAGDCGGPVICNESKIIRKICGIHIAGSSDGSEAYGQSVTQQDLIDSLNKFSSVIITDLDSLPNFVPREASLQCNVEYCKSELVELLGLPADTFGFAGNCSRVPYTPCKTDIRPSVIHGYTDTLTKPALLYHRDVNLLHKNVEKCAVNTPFISRSEVMRAVDEVKPKLLSGESRRRLARVLTFEEAVSGSDTSEYTGSINRSTSPGYPWTLERKCGSKGKTQWLGEDSYIFDETVRDAVNERIKSAERGIRMPTVWTDTLKDERRPVEKVNALKTRVFSFGPFDYTIAFRMYFLGFIAHIMENRIANEQSIGTNVYSSDWARTFAKLQTRGSRVFAGDFSTFDGTLNSCIMSEFAAVANAFYDDGPLNAKVREVLMLDVFNSIHLCENVFYTCTHSQPSGNPLTTILNSFYNSVSMRIAFYRVVGNKFNFDDHVSMVSYGDDNVVNITDVVSAVFNQETCTQAYASFGMTYTDEAKSGVIVPYRNISEVAYLKRGFRQEDGYVRAPMSLDTVMETPQWYRDCPDSLLACKMNLENSLMELALHPEEVFDEKSKLMIDAFYTRTTMYPDAKSRSTYLALINEDYF
jgi:hypothetical protein